MFFCVSLGTQQDFRVIFYVFLCKFRDTARFQSDFLCFFV